jgi:hypothetical protein
VVEGERERVVDDVGDAPQPGVGGVGAGDELGDVATDSEEGDADDVAARVAPGIAVGAEPQQRAWCGDAGLLGELTHGGVVEGLVRSLEATGERPRPGERLAVAADQHDVQVALDDGEHDDVDGDGERWVVADVVARRCCGGRSSLRHGTHSRRFVVRLTITLAR